MTKKELLQIINRLDTQAGHTDFVEWLKTSHEMIDYADFKQRVIERAIEAYVNEVIGDEPPKDFGYGYAEINGHEHYLDSEQTDLIREVLAEQKGRASA